MRISSSQTRTTGRTIRPCLVRPAAVRRRCLADSRTVTFRGAGPADDCAPDPPLSIRKSRTVRRLPTGPVTPRDRSDRRRLARGPVCHPARQTDPPGRPAPQLRRPAPFPHGGSGFPPRSPDHRTPRGSPTIPPDPHIPGCVPGPPQAPARIPPPPSAAARLLAGVDDAGLGATVLDPVSGRIQFGGRLGDHLRVPLRGVSAGVFSGVTQQCGPPLGAPLT